MRRLLLVLHIFLLLSGPAAGQGLERPSGREPAVFIEDGRGRKVAALPQKGRIASATVATDEILYELLKRSGQLERLVGLSDLADDPRYSNIVDFARSVQGRIGRELEGIVVLRPDLVLLASFTNPAIVRRLEQARIGTFVIDGFKSFKDIARHVDTIGRLVGSRSAASLMLKDFELALQEARFSGKSRYLPKVINFTPSGHLAGSGTMFDAIVTAAGGRNLLSQKKYHGWPKLSPEVIAQLDPLWVVAAGSDQDRPQLLKYLRGRPGWQALTAIKAGRLLMVPEKELSAVSPYVVNAVAYLRRALHPQVEIPRSFPRLGMEHADLWKSGPSP